MSRFRVRGVLATAILEKLNYVFWFQKDTLKMIQFYIKSCRYVMTLSE